MGGTKISKEPRGLQHQERKAQCTEGERSRVVDTCHRVELDGIPLEQLLREYEAQRLEDETGHRKAGPYEVKLKIHFCHTGNDDTRADPANVQKKRPARLLEPDGESNYKRNRRQGRFEHLDELNGYVPRIR